eukprot:2592069-Rhodomonas_salina.5
MQALVPTGWYAAMQTRPYCGSIEAPMNPRDKTVLFAPVRCVPVYRSVSAACVPVYRSVSAAVSAS